MLPLGLRYMLISASGFALMNCCVKWVNSGGIPILEIIAARALVSLLISLGDIKRKNISPWGHDKKMLLARGLIGTLALICVYYAVTTLPLAEATILKFTQPVFTVIFAIVLLKERFKMSILFCIALSMLGLYIIVSPNLKVSASASLSSLSIFVALLAAFGSSIAYIIVKKLSKKEDTSVIIFYFPLIALPISVVLLAKDFIWPSFEQGVALILIGIFTQIGQYGLTKAMVNDDASQVIPYSYIQVIFAIILGIYLFNEIPSIYTLLGGLCIFLGVLVNVWGPKILPITGPNR